MGEKFCGYKKKMQQKVQNNRILTFAIATGERTSGRGRSGSRPFQSNLLLKSEFDSSFDDLALKS